MIFTELRFGGFFLLVFVVHWLLRSPRGRKVWLLLASYAFYCAWDWRFLGLLLTSSFADYGLARAIARAPTPGQRKLLLGFSLALNLGLLGFFKYWNFFVTSGAELLSWLGVPCSPATLELVLPLGISFYTFQTLSYTIDVYRGRLSPSESLLDVALFVSFFPQLLAGPIVRAARFLPQLATPRRFAAIDHRLCLLLLLVGFAKKACLSDNLAPLVDRYFAAPEGYGCGSAWLGLFLFGVQIYCDFSGYADMARGAAGLLGYEVGVNFRFPLFARSLPELWRAWHVTLTAWIFDYVYAPLERLNPARRVGRSCLNLVLTLTAIGLWHGPRLGFVLWGFVHGLGLALHLLWQRGQVAPRTRRWVGAGSRPLVIAFAFLSLALFRSPTLAGAWTVLARACSPAAQGATLAGSSLVFGLAGLVGVHYLAFRGWLFRPLAALPSWLFAPVFGILVALALAFAHRDPAPFVYFEF